MLPELLPFGTGSLFVVLVALARLGPVVRLQARSAVALHEAVFSGGHDLALWTLPPGVQLHTGAFARVVDKVLEAGALRRARGRVVGEVLAHRAGTR